MKSHATKDERQVRSLRVRTSVKAGSDTSSGDATLDVEYRSYGPGAANWGGGSGIS